MKIRLNTMVLIALIMNVVCSDHIASPIEGSDDVSDVTRYKYEDFERYYDIENNKITSFENMLPTLILHGLGDNCNTGSVEKIVDVFKGFNKIHGTKLYVECLELLP
jgi:hypothetical protein